MQNVVETNKSGSDMELHHAVVMGQLEIALHMVAITGNLQILKYFITERNCNPAFPGQLDMTPLHLASQ